MTNSIYSAVPWRQVSKIWNINSKMERFTKKKHILHCNIFRWIQLQQNWSPKVKTVATKWFASVWTNQKRSWKPLGLQQRFLGPSLPLPILLLFSVCASLGACYCFGTLGAGYWLRACVLEGWDFLKMAADSVVGLQKSCYPHGSRGPSKCLNWLIYLLNHVTTIKLFFMTKTKIRFCATCLH